MDVREKLVELLEKLAIRTLPKNTCRTNLVMLANALLENGVTVQEWISVKDRLPEEECRCLVIDAADDIEMDCYDGKGRFVLDRSGAVQHPSHWMPLPKMPQPPKGD